MENRQTILTCLIVILMALTRLSEGGYVAQCNRLTFDHYVHGYCLPNFNQSMEASNYQHRCPWPTFKDSYIILKHCVEQVGTSTGCVEPSLKDDIFLEVHQMFFSLCSRVEDPAFAVLMLLILPCVITILLLPLLCVHITTTTGL
ncbi:uncharacterized protein LOC110501381 [Oncorhynchus mykiss]|uniref:uncharacterized protein LOC110501381 n=1 Tax=Oncorhynchus mykiss TaxID=8022 RepID=UPI001877CF0E|nr:uncharacterized protein LOC110501381 [Oncorhynchus mykiss]XP_021434588.2 uncharacterized protein LOC110501381 [Oncorhynchus mykiss]